jgi:N-acetylmuramoyl-L-alanine amidase
MTHSDYYLTALTIYREARGEGKAGMEAVFHVIRNRVTDKRWPDTYAGVCLFSAMPKGGNRRIYHFSCFDPADLQSHYIPAPSDPLFQLACSIVEEPPEADPTNGANHYHATYVQPKWSRGQSPVARIGKHLFYRL